MGLLSALAPYPGIGGGGATPSSFERRLSGPFEAPKEFGPGGEMPSPNASVTFVPLDAAGAHIDDYRIEHARCAYGFSDIVNETRQMPLARKLHGLHKPSEVFSDVFSSIAMVSVGVASAAGVTMAFHLHARLLKRCTRGKIVKNDEGDLQCAQCAPLFDFFYQLYIPVLTTVEIVVSMIRTFLSDEKLRTTI